MTPREELIQGISQIPDSLINDWLKLVRLSQTSDFDSVKRLKYIISQSLAHAPQHKVPDSSKPSAYELAKDLAGCVEGGPTDLSTNPKHMEGFGA